MSGQERPPTEEETDLGIEFHACMTGDCPHTTWTECLRAALEDAARLEAERVIPVSLPLSGADQKVAVAGLRKLLYGSREYLHGEALAVFWELIEELWEDRPDLDPEGG